jgi:hypothetical protein
MADTPTKLSDVIVPELFAQYVREQNTKSSQFFQSGIIASVGELNFGQRGGLMLEMPYWKSLGERAQLLDDGYDLEIKKIQTGQDTAVQHARALVYGATDLAGVMAGSDPMSAIGDGVAANWSQEFTAILLATLRGSMSVVTDNNHDISSLSGTAAYLDAASFIDGAQKLGDQKDKVVGIAMHSAVEASLAKADLIESIRDSEGKLIMSTFLSKRVIVDDSLVADSGGAYMTYLFGPGAIGYAEGSPKVPSETARNPLINGGQEYIVSRRHFVMHPRGIRWTPSSGVPAKMTPSDAELADSGNWLQAYESKNIRIVAIKHQIA